MHTESMEDNTAYIARKIWRKILPPALFCDLWGLFVFQVAMFFLASHFCPPDDLVIFSAFLPFWNIAYLTSCFFAFGASQYFSIWKGAQNQEKAQNVFGETTTAFLLLAVCCTALQIWQMPNIVRFLGVKGNLTASAIRYGTWMTVAVWMDSISGFLREFLRCDSLPKQGALCSVGSALILLVIMAIGIGVFHRTVNFLNISIIIASFFSISGYLSFIFRKKTTIRPQIRRMRATTFREIFKLSSGNLIGFGFGFFAGLIVVRWTMNSFGPAAMTILALCNQIQAVFHYLNTPFITSMQALCGMFRGERNWKGVSIVAWMGIRRDSLVLLSFELLVVLFAPQIVRWMPVQENFVGEAALALRLSSVGFFFRQLFCYLCGFYNVCGHTKLVSTCMLLVDTVIYYSWLWFFVFFLQDEKLYWGNPTMIWGSALLLMRGLAEIVKRWGKYPDPLLIKMEKTSDPTYHFLLHGENEDFQDYQMMLQTFLKKHSVPPPTVTKTMHLFEELFLFAQERTSRKKGAFFSLVTSIREEGVCLSLQYDSAESCLNSVLNGQWTQLSPDQLAGAKILSSLADELVIDRVYGFNCIHLKIRQPA